MAGNPFFSGRIPRELNDSVIKHCEETGKSKTQVLVEALSNYLNIPIPEISTNLRVEVTKEQFVSLENRVASLEALLAKVSVITTNNNDNTLDNVDNTIAESTQKDGDNTNENNDNKNSETPPTYENIDSEELSKLAGLKTPEKVNLKAQAFRKAQKEGYVIGKEVKFSPAIETQLRRGIIINGNEYKLLCKGTDEKEKPIWSLKPYDNISYQPDIAF